MRPCVCPVASLLDSNPLPLRFPQPEPASDHREEDVRVHGEPGRLPAVGDDVRELPEAAGLQQHRYHEGEAADRRPRGPAVLPPVLSPRARLPPGRRRARPLV